MSRFLTLFLMLLATQLCSAQRSKETFDFDWKFILNHDQASNALPETTDKDWTDVQLPHDWSISLPFDPKQSGSSAHLRSGIGWYRKTFECKAGKNERISILFDGIYNRSDVYINGHHLGFRPYGFGYIEYDLTPHLSPSGRNLLAVRVNNPSNNDSIARWYTGSGIYRHAWLLRTPLTHIQTYGTYITTPEVSREATRIRLRATVENSGTTPTQTQVLHIIRDANGREVGRTTASALSVEAGSTADAQTELTLRNCRLWDVDDPYLYTVETRLIQKGRTIDSYETPIGLRTAVFTSDQGFLLNGRRLKLQGFCLHQDDASLGAALPLRSMERKLAIIKEYGVNAIRCAHNQPAPEFLDLCDQMGFVVIDEAFDKWKYYAEYFDQWWKHDLQNMLQRDRNHPCVILWSEGNEVQEAWDSSPVGAERARMLQDFIHAYEPTRQVCLSAQNRHNEQFAGVTDVIGYNYLEARMISDHKKYPHRRSLITEELPYYCGAEGNIRSYDTTNPWTLIAAHDFVAGGFIWAGVDYIGEASWPSHGWPNGLFDICMEEKPRAAYHRAVWNPRPMVRIAVRDNSLNIDHGRDLWQWPPMAAIWNFPDSYRELVMEVQTITNCERVALYLNGNEMGVKHTANFPNNTIIWNIPYKPGRVEAVGLNGNDTVARYEIRTASQPAKLTAEADRTQLTADGQDLSYIRIQLFDANGTLVQHENVHIRASIEGAGRLIGCVNSDLRRTTPFTDTQTDTYFGRAMAIVQTTRTPGPIRLRLDIDNWEQPVYVDLQSIAPSKKK
jgi:beta-galactosidase